MQSIRFFSHFTFDQFPLSDTIKEQGIILEIRYKARDR